MNRLKQPLEHDDFLNYRLKRIVTVGGAPAIRLCEGRYGVARSEWRLVAALVEYGDMAPTELARRSHIEQGRCSRLVVTLLDKRLVRRTAVSDAHQRSKLSVTEAGRHLYRDLFPQLAAINGRLMQALTEEEAYWLDRCLAKLEVQAATIEAAGGGVDVLANRRLGGTRRPRPPFDDTRA